MRKILILILMLSIGSFVFAEENQEQEPVRFVYINGANNDTPKMKNWFFEGIDKLHPQMQKQFTSSEFVYDKFLKNGKRSILTQPEIFFWGDETAKNLKTVDAKLELTDMFSPKLAQTIRSVFGHCMHDAIWVQKNHNMQKIVRELHGKILECNMRGEKAVLFGYSAGSFVTYRYLFYKLPYITDKVIAKKMKLNEEQLQYISEHKINPTCVDALTQVKLAYYTSEERLIPNSNFEEFKKAYDMLDETTNTACVPNNTVLGIVNYASPLVLFYSDFNDPTLEITEYNEDLFVHMKNNNIFWLTVNFSNDPLGYPLSRNLTDEEIEEMHNMAFDKNGRGFFHDKSDTSCPTICLTAHTSYWKYAKRFAKAVVKAFEEGYKNFYPEDYEENL